MIRTIDDELLTGKALLRASEQAAILDRQQWPVWPHSIALNGVLVPRYWMLIPKKPIFAASLLSLRRTTLRVSEQRLVDLYQP